MSDGTDPRQYRDFERPVPRKTASPEDGEAVYQRFYEAWWRRETETTDFDLHAETVDAFIAAHEDVLRLRGELAA